MEIQSSSEKMCVKCSISNKTCGYGRELHRSSTSTLGFSNQRQTPRKHPGDIFYGHNQYRKTRKDDIDLGMLDGHCFYAIFLSFTLREHLTRHKENEWEGIKTTIICRVKKVKRMINSSDKAFYRGASNLGYAACQWIELMSEKTGTHIHHAFCGHGGERQLIVESVRLMVTNLLPGPSTSLTGASGTDVLVNQIEPLGIRSDILQRKGRKKR